MQRWQCRSSGLAMLLALGIATPVRAAEPRATFALQAGWVDLSVRQDGKPVAGAVIRILDERGMKFAEGETGALGETAFPMPPGASCTVEIKTGERTADPIRLVETGGGVEPARVLLSYGLRPCCRSVLVQAEPIIVGHPVEPPAEWKDSIYPWAVLGAALFGVVAAAAYLWLTRRCPGIPTKGKL